MTVNEAAEILGVTGARVRQLIGDGKLKAGRFGHKIHDVNPASVNALLNKRAKWKQSIADKKQAIIDKREAKK